MPSDTAQRFREQLGARLAAARERAGLSSGEAARQLGISPATISAYEHGHRGPSVEGMVRLAELYGCDYGDLLP